MSEAQIESRVTFHDDLEIMEVDFSELNFKNSQDVNECYDVIESMINETQRKWYFMVNYANTKIEPEAWFQHARRGSKLNAASSLGSVRFNPAEPARQALLQRTQMDEQFNPNLVSTREEAMVRIMEMKDDSKQG